MKTKKKVLIKNETLFSPNSSEDQKKEQKGLHQKRNTFSPNSSGRLRSDARQSQIIGGMRMYTIRYSNYWGEYSQIIGGDISPHSPRVSAPLLTMPTASLPCFCEQIKLNPMEATHSMFCFDFSDKVVCSHGKP